MIPLPKENSPKSAIKGSPMPALPSLLDPASTTSYSSANRRSPSCGAQKVYPVLLCASTLVAGAFCMLYITKPVILAASNPAAISPIVQEQAAMNPQEKPRPEAPVSTPSLLPSANRLPGESAAATPDHPSADSTSPASPPLPSLPKSEFEETNIRIQHILTAQSPGGNLARIDIEVPVLYQSRNLRWTAQEVQDARELLARLADYQERSSLLRSEGAELLSQWNHLIERSIPSRDLRADSPTLPVNQQDAASAPRSGALSTSDSIQIKATGK